MRNKNVTPKEVLVTGKVIRDHKRNKTMQKFNYLQQKYDLIYLESKNGMVIFEFNQITYYYALMNEILRVAGTNVWYDYKLLFPDESIDFRIHFIFGKYYSKSYQEIKQNDIQYLQWVVDNLSKPEIDFIKNILD